MRYSLLLLVAIAGVAAGAAVTLVVGAPATDIKAADWLQFAGAMVGVVFAIWGALAVEHWRQREAEGKEELLLLSSMIALLQAAKKFETIVEFDEDFEDFVPQAQKAVSSLGVPVLSPELLVPWPADKETVVGLNESVLSVFDGPRVLFPDGFSRGQLNVRAAYYDAPASFTHSVGVIAGSKVDAPLLKFVAVYLRSTLARYFLMMRGWKMLCERNGIHLTDVDAFPFFPPEDAPDPEAATAALAVIDAYVDKMADKPDLIQQIYYESVHSELDNAVFSYFGLKSEERTLITETVKILMPSIRPRSFKSLDTPAQRTAGGADFSAYAGALARALTAWRDRTRGQGQFSVNVVTNDPRRAGLSGIVRIRYAETGQAATAADARIDDELVLESLTALRKSGLRTIPSGDHLSLFPDAHLWINGSLYLVRPLTQRSWTVRQALRDAEHIVRTVQSRAGAEKSAATA